MHNNLSTHTRNQIKYTIGDLFISVHNYATGSITSIEWIVNIATWGVEAYRMADQEIYFYTYQHIESCERMNKMKHFPVKCEQI